jgi:predicted acyl esterase
MGEQERCWKDPRTKKKIKNIKKKKQEKKPRLTGKENMWPLMHSYGNFSQGYLRHWAKGWLQSTLYSRQSTRESRSKGFDRDDGEQFNV